MSTYALLIAKATREYFHKNFDGVETEYLAQWIFPVYGIYLAEECIK